MKIAAKYFSWSNISQQFAKAVTPLRREVGVRRLSSKNPFRAFSHWGDLSLAAPHEQKAIDVKMLEQIGNDLRSKNLSYQSFISFHLQQSPVDTNSQAMLRRSLAIEKMLALLTQTIHEMKFIELKRISHCKG